MATTYDEDLLIKVRDIMVRVRTGVFAPDNPIGTVFCVHDFAGTGADFQQLGVALCANGYRVVCPDMPGRGASAYLDDFNAYDVVTFGTVLANIMRHFGTADNNIVIGKDWGAGIALLVLSRMGARVGKVVISDLEPVWTPEGAPDVQRLMRDADRTFESLDEARNYVLEGGSLASLSPVTREAFLMRRIRRDEAGFRMQWDPGLAHKFAQLKVRSFNLSRLLMGTSSEALLLYGPKVSEAERKVIDAITTLRPQTHMVDGLTEAGPVHYSDFGQVMLTLGFINARLGTLTGDMAIRDISSSPTVADADS